MKGPNPGGTKWRINEVGAEERGGGGRARRKKRDTIIDVRRGREREVERRIRGGGGGGRCGGKGTRMRKVDSEVYTVRRDLINPPELRPGRRSSPPFLPLVRKDALCSPRRLCAPRRRSKFQVMACSDRWKSFLSFIIAGRCLALYSYRSVKIVPRRKYRRVKCCAREFPVSGSVISYRGAKCSTCFFFFFFSTAFDDCIRRVR